MDNRSSVIPEQTKGKKVDLHETAQLKSSSEASDFYKQTCEKLFNINNWHELSGSEKINFSVTDSKGKLKADKPAVGDYIMIGLPAPGSIEGNGYDWVRIKIIKFPENFGTDDLCYLTVHPSENPFNKNGCTAHFFLKRASSTFIVERKNNSVTAWYHGRNESPNIKETKGIVEKFRHLVISLSALAGFSKIQWKIFVKNLIDS